MRTNRTVTAAMALTLAIGLAACDTGQEAGPSDQGATGTQDARGSQDAQGGQDGGASSAAGPDGAAPATASEPQATEADDDPDDDVEDNDEDGVVGLGPGAEVTPSALAALESAVAAAGGTAYEVDDREDGFWEVGVVTGGSTTVVTVSPDGTTVDSTEEGGSALDAETAEAVAAAQTTLADAVVAAVGTGEGQLGSAGLGEQDGTWAWSVTVTSPDEDDVKLLVDPTTGKVVRPGG